MTQQQIFELSEGNIGAVNFILDALKINQIIAAEALQRMHVNGITGAKLYMVWNDCCNRDTCKAMAVMYKMPIDDLKKHLNYDYGRGIPIDMFEEEHS